MAQKWFPIQFRSSPHGARLRVPWRIAEKAWKKYAELGHGDQSCDRLAERGGFGLLELIYLLADEDPWRLPAEDLEVQSDFFNRFSEEKRKED